MMENNVIQQNYLEISPSKQIVKCSEDKLLQISPNINNELLPVIIKNEELALIKIQNRDINLDKSNRNNKILNIAKATIKIIEKVTKKTISLCAGIVGFIGVSVLIIVSTAIITKNIVNSYYGNGIQTDTTYSIFKLKDN